MNRYELSYQSKTPRAAIAVAALALSVLTMTAMVGVPASLTGSDATVLARATPAEVTINPARIDVVATREANMTLAAVSMPHVDSDAR
jgi:hypothetical protein